MAGMSSDSREMDFQARFEKALTAVPLFKYCNIIFGLGNLNSAKTYSVEQLVTDADMAGALRCLFPAKTESDGRQVCDLIKSVSPGGHYLCEDHTLHHFRNYWRPLFSTALLNILPTIAGMFFMNGCKSAPRPSWHSLWKN